MKRLPRVLPCILAASSLLIPQHVRAQGNQYDIGKLATYTQTGPSQLALNAGSPYEFNAIGSLQGTLTSPDSHVDQLTFVTADQAYEVVQYYPTQAAMDAAYPSGSYTFNLFGQAPVTLTITGDLYPPIPQVVEGSWNGTSLLVDPNSNYVINFNAFPGYADSGEGGYVGLRIINPGVAVVFNMQSVSSDSPDPTSVTIPAGTLTEGSYYSGQLVFSTSTVLDGTSVPGSLLIASYFTANDFVILAQAPAAIAPVAVSQPVSQTVASGGSVVYTFATTGSPAPAVQWYLNGVAIASGTNPTLVLVGVTPANSGTLTCTATNASGTVTSSPAALNVVVTSNPGRLVNLSARAEVGTGGNIVFGGFAIGPLGTSGMEPILVRASGPALVQFGVPGTLADPQLQLFSAAGAVLDTNQGWAGSASIAATAAAVGAFPWTAEGSHDAALDVTLASGAYTAQVAGESGDTGDALVEVYDATPAGTYTPSMPRLVNLSARVDVGTGANALFAGFVIGGSTSLTVLIRASGPAIAAAPFNVPGTLADPQLTLQNQATQAVIATNNSWAGDSIISSASSYVGAFAWNNPSSHDSALLITLPPGNYTAEAAGASGDSGVAIVEVYEVP
jgi:hypothetical protein